MKPPRRFKNVNPKSVHPCPMCGTWIKKPLQLCSASCELAVKLVPWLLPPNGFPVMLIPEVK